MNRLRQGYVKWVNPFNHRPQYISFANAKVIVFWSKNPDPMMQFLPKLDERLLAYYFHFTLNNYDGEGLEPGVPPMSARIKTFRDLSGRIGRDRVIWRFDLLILTKSLDVERLLERIRRVGDQIATCTTKLVFSFADIGCYRKVQNNLKRAGIEYREFSEDMMLEAASGIAALCKEWGIAASTCAELLDLSQFGIQHNRCIDDDLILRITKNNPLLRRLFGIDISMEDDLFGFPQRAMQIAKDPGQRAECGCVFSKDIGQYNTCPHLCIYCYANTSEMIVRRNTAFCSQSRESILSDAPTDDSNEKENRYPRMGGTGRNP